MDEQELNALVEARVQEELAKRESAERVSEESNELRGKMNQGLNMLAQSAQMEPASGYGSGRDFSRGRELSRKEGVRSAAAMLAEEVREDLRGTQWELDDD